MLNHNIYLYQSAASVAKNLIKLKNSFTSTKNISSMTKNILKYKQQCWHASLIRKNYFTYSSMGNESIGVDKNEHGSQLSISQINIPYEIIYHDLQMQKKSIEQILATNQKDLIKLCKQFLFIFQMMDKDNCEYLENNIQRFLNVFQSKLSDTQTGRGKSIHVVTEQFVHFYLENFKKQIVDKTEHFKITTKYIQKIEQFLSSDKNPSFQQRLNSMIDNLRNNYLYSQRSVMSIKNKLRSLNLLPYLSQQQASILLKKIEQDQILKYLNKSQLALLLFDILTVKPKLSLQFIEKILALDSYVNLTKLGQVQIKVHFVRHIKYMISSLKQSHFSQIFLSPFLRRTKPTIMNMTRMLMAKKEEISLIQAQYNKSILRFTFNVLLSHIMSMNISVDKVPIEDLIQFYLILTSVESTGEFFYKRLNHYFKVYTNNFINNVPQKYVEDLVKILDYVLNQRKPCLKYERVEGQNKQLSQNSYVLILTLLKLIIPHRPQIILEVEDLRDYVHIPEQIANTLEKDDFLYPSIFSGALKPFDMPQQDMLSYQAVLQILQTLQKKARSIKSDNQLSMINKILDIAIKRGPWVKLNKDIVQKWIFESIQVLSNPLKKIKQKAFLLSIFSKIIKTISYPQVIAQYNMGTLNYQLKSLSKVLLNTMSTLNKTPQTFINSNKSYYNDILVCIGQVIKFSQLRSQLNQSALPIIQSMKVLELFINKNMKLSVKSAIKDQSLDLLIFMKKFKHLCQTNKSNPYVPNLNVDVYVSLYKSLSTFLVYNCSNTTYYFKKGYYKQFLEIVKDFTNNKHLFIEAKQRQDLAILQVILVQLIRYKYLDLDLKATNREQNARILLDYLEIFNTIQFLTQDLLQIVKNATFNDIELQHYDSELLITFSDINDSIWSYLQENNTTGIKSVAGTKKLTKLDQRQLRDQLERKHIYTSLIKHQHFKLPFDLPPPKVKDHQAQLCYVIESAFQKIKAVNNYDVPQGKSEGAAQHVFKEVSLEEEKVYLLRNNLVKLSQQTEFKLLGPKIPKHFKVEVWKSIEGLTEKDQVSGLQIGQKMSQVVYQYLAQGLFGYMEKIKKLAEEFPNFTFIDYIAAEQNLQINKCGCISQLYRKNSPTESIALLCSSESNYKILYICAYLLNKSGQKAYIITSKTPKSTVKSLVASQIAKPKAQQSTSIDQDGTQAIIDSLPKSKDQVV